MRLVMYICLQILAIVCGLLSSWIFGVLSALTAMRRDGEKTMMMLKEVIPTTMGILLTQISALPRVVAPLLLLFETPGCGGRLDAQVD